MGFCFCSNNKPYAMSVGRLKYIFLRYLVFHTLDYFARYRNISSKTIALRVNQGEVHLGIL